MSKWLVTGGAGYIGAHIVRAFQSEGIEPVVLDNLASGFAKFVPAEVVFVKGDICDTELVTTTLIDNDIEGVIHVAGFKYAGVSVKQPLTTYDNNVTGTASILKAMQIAGVENFVFSSSASVYGTPSVELVKEDAPKAPESPYGETKLIGEWLVRDLIRAREDFRGVNLRYFNVVGSATPQIYDASPHNLFPLICGMLVDGKTPKIFGDDYDTPDGTCVRDYVHVGDLAFSHVAAAKALQEGRPLQEAYNLGSGAGLSVRQIMDTFAEVTGIDFTPEIASRRPGDPARIVADGTLASQDLAWKMRYGVTEMVETAWEAWKYEKEA